MEKKEEVKSAIWMVVVVVHQVYEKVPQTRVYSAVTGSRHHHKDPNGIFEGRVSSPLFDSIKVPRLVVA